MLAHYVVGKQQCEYCESDIHVGFEALWHEDGLFCEMECLLRHLFEMSHTKTVYLTDNKLYRSEN